MLVRNYSMLGISFLKFEIIKKRIDMFLGIGVHKKTDNQSYEITTVIGKYVCSSRVLI